MNKCQTSFPHFPPLPPLFPPPPFPLPLLRFLPATAEGLWKRVQEEPGYRTIFGVFAVAAPAQ